MRIVDLSAPIVPSPAGVPQALRTDIEFADHAAGAAQVEAMFGVGPDLLRNGEGWAVETFTCLGTHNSTHVDAPYHYNSVIGQAPARRIDELPLEWFFGPGVVLDFTGRADGETIEPGDVRAALDSAGHALAEQDIVLLRTGRDVFYEQSDYMIRGPGVSAAATRWLYERGVRVMGIDAWGWDRPLNLQAEEARAAGRRGIFWAAHQTDLDYAQIERLVNLDALPPTGFTVACFPLRVVGASAAPAPRGGHPALSLVARASGVAAAGLPPRRSMWTVLGFLGGRSRKAVLGCALVCLSAVPAASARQRIALARVNGMVYIESNSAAPRSNAILAFPYVHGVLRRRGVRRYRTGGSGSHDLSNAGVLDADQEVVVNGRRTLLFAVNSGSDTIAIFHIHPGGALTPVPGSPFPSHGKAPTSLGLAGRTLIVANKAQDGIRRLSSVPANYTSFHIRPDGALGPPISSINVPPRSSPLQAYVTPDQRVLITSEETGVFRAFRIGRDGTLTQGPNSPQGLPNAVFPGHQRVLNVWPAGLVSHPRLKILYAQLANVSRTIVYRWDDSARLTFLRALVNPKSFLPCWTHVNAAGTRMYSGNAGSDNLSVFDIARHPTNPREIQSVALNAPGNPWNFQLDPSGNVIFLLDMRAVRQIPAGQGNQLHSLRIGPRGRLREERGSPARIPVPVGTNPVGLVIVPAPRG